MPAEASPPAVLLDWTHEFELGVAELDRQHRDLLGHVNGFARVLTHDERAGPAMTRLLQAAVAHFDFEEGLMSRAGYTGAVLHAEQHAELLAAMERLRRRLAHPFPEDERRKALDFLHDWFAIHIIRSDADLVRHLKALQPA